MLLLSLEVDKSHTCLSRMINVNVNQLMSTLSQRIGIGFNDHVTTK